LDLYLWNATGDRLLDASTDTGEHETVRAGQSGLQLLEVVAYRGASNYLLVVGHDPIPGIQSGLRLSAEFVSGEVVLERRTSAQADALSAGRSSSAEAAAPRSGRPELLRLWADGVARTQAATSHRPAVLERVDDVALRRRLETLLAIKSLRSAPSVVYAQPNFRVLPQTVPDDPFYPLQWHYPMIDLPAAWNLGAGDGVTVAVLDTGVLADHPDLAGQLLPGYDFVRSVDAAGDGDGVDPYPLDPGPGEGGGAAPFHGTHVAGTVAAAAYNGAGTAGVAYRARVLPVRVLGVSGGSSYDIMQGVRFAAGLENDSGITVPPVDVINLSLGRRGPCWPGEQAAFDAARRAGVTIVAAAGNDAIDAADAFPASCRNVIAVGAVDPDRAPTSYSNFGAAVDVYAPGGSSADGDGDGYRDGVLSLMGTLDPDGAIRYGYAFRHGTSMASPHVAGVVALMKSLNPALTPDDVDRLLSAGALTDPDGIINARRASFAALDPLQSPAVEPRPRAAPAALNFGSAFNYAEVRVTASCAATELELAAAAPWLRLDGVAAASDGTSTVAVTVDRGMLAAGTYSDAIAIGCAGRYVEVPVILQVIPAPFDADAGHLHVLLIDADSGALVRRTEARASAGRYVFEFDGVAAGRYRLAAGTDADNDGAICDAGESCGRYRNAAGDPILIVDGHQSGVEFGVGHRVSITGRSAGLEGSVPRGASGRSGGSLPD
ncbi:MAG TPA: S8 family peptidase, partial [Pseudomonadales bacterium]